MQNENLDTIKHSVKRFYDEHEDLVLVFGLIATTAVTTTALNAIVTRRLLNNTTVQIQWKQPLPPAGQAGIFDRYFGRRLT